MITPGSPERLVFLDVLRGVALFGILLVNLFAFGADSIAWTDPADRGVWWVKHVFFESKFWVLYSLLFGMGLHIQLLSLRYTTAAMVRRLGFLMVIGCLHALVFEGDILMLYAELGLLMLILKGLLLKRLSHRSMIWMAVVLAMSFPLGHLLGGDRGDDWPANSPSQAAQWLEQDRESSVFSIGTPGDVASELAQFIPERFWVDWQYPDSGWLVLASMLMGWWVMGVGLSRLALWSRRRVIALCGFGWLAGGCLMVLERYAHHAFHYALFDRSDTAPITIFYMDIVYLSATVFLAFAWFLSIWLWVHSDAMPALRLRVARAGRMSLSLYLMQTLIFTGVFYGYGLGYAYELGPMQVAFLALLIYGAQLLFASLWSRYFLYGPMEWLWRWVTHLHRSPLRTD